MNWRKELNTFWNTFMQAYPENQVPEDVIFPWLTYPIQRGMFQDETVGSVHLHYHTDSESVPNEMADRIVNEVDGKMIECDEGVLVLSVGQPAWFPVVDEDKTHKHRIININTLWLLTR